MNDHIKKPARKIFSISQLNKQAKNLLETGFGLIWVEGEISNLSIPQSGHWYFTLKDNNAQINCAMFRNKNRFINPPADGDRVLIRTRVSLFEARGNYQLILEYLEPAGFGQLQRQFEQLKNKLEAEGLFSEAHKKTIPHPIYQLGLITSATGAAIHDILSIIKRRFAAMEVILYPVQVQGDRAHESIIQALEVAQQRNEVEALLITRGGGSLEDLWCFNEEALAHAIHHCQLPVISAIGHEVDFTIADFTADLRASTPSAAAEILTPDTQQLLHRLSRLQQQLHQQIKNTLQLKQQQLDWLSRRLINPAQRLIQQHKDLKVQFKRLNAAIKQRLQNFQQLLLSKKTQLRQLAPHQKILTNQQLINQLQQRLNRIIRQILSNQQQKLSSVSHQLDTLSPLATLQRGFTITRTIGKEVINSPSTLKKGELIETVFAEGKLRSKVTQICKK